MYEKYERSEGQKWVKEGSAKCCGDVWQISRHERVKGGKTWLIDGKITSFTLMYDVSEVIGGNNIRYIDM